MNSRILSLLFIVSSFIAGCGTNNSPSPAREQQQPVTTIQSQDSCHLSIDKLDVEIGPNFTTNCYVLSDPASKKSFVIDPGAQPKRIAQAIARKGLQLAGIIITHAHPDHIDATAELQSSAPSVPIYAHPDHRKILGQLGQSISRLKIHPVEEGTVLQIGCNNIKIFHTPGHSPGSICIYSENMNTVFTGDLLFANSVGRTDLPGGDKDRLIKEVNRITNILPEKTRVLPGHGEETSIGAEKTNNPFIRQPML